MLNKLGFIGHQKKHIRKRASKIALRSSFFIWTNRFKPSWFPPSLVKTPTTCNFPPTSHPIIYPTPLPSPIFLSINHSMHVNPSPHTGPPPSSPSFTSSPSSSSSSSSSSTSSSFSLSPPLPLQRKHTSPPDYQYP